MQLLLTETNNKLLTQTDLVTNLQFQINNYDSTILAMQQKYDTQARLSQELEVALKRSKRQAKLYKIGTYVGLGAIGILLVK
jgi:2C-methyl-D-erythritol 2,4-cyclodiphosphate synthase